MAPMQISKAAFSTGYFPWGTIKRSQTTKCALEYTRFRELGLASGRGIVDGPYLRREAETLSRSLEDMSLGRALAGAGVAALDGVWHLVLLSTDPYKREGLLQRLSLENSFCKRGHAEGQVTQLVNTETMQIENSAQMSVLGLLLKMRVTAKMDLLDDEETVALRFLNAYYKLAFLPWIVFPVWLLRWQGTMRTTHLNDSWRIGKSDRGSIFVLSREPLKQE